MCGREGPVRCRGASAGVAVSATRTTEGAASAWRFLRKNPNYIVEWWTEAAGIPRPEGEPFPIHRQREADLAVAAWGLLAWEDPLDPDGPASPFWTDAPMVEGEPGRKGSIPFASLMRAAGVRLEGLLLLDGTMVLKIEHGAAAGQVRIEDGEAFDPAGPLGLHVPWGSDHLVQQLARAGDLRSVVAQGEEAEEGAPSPGISRASFCSPSTAR